MAIDKKCNKLKRILKNIDKVFGSIYSYGVTGEYEMSGETEDCYIIDCEFNKLVDEAITINKNMERVEFGEERIQI